MEKLFSEEAVRMQWRLMASASLKRLEGHRTIIPGRMLRVLSNTVSVDVAASWRPRGTPTHALWCPPSLPAAPLAWERPCERFRPVCALRWCLPHCALVWPQEDGRTHSCWGWEGRRGAEGCLLSTWEEVSGVLAVLRASYLAHANRPCATRVLPLWVGSARFWHLSVPSFCEN